MAYAPAASVGALVERDSESDIRDIRIGRASTGAYGSSGRTVRKGAR